MTTPSERLDLATVSTLTFEPPDSERFPALRLAREALKIGGKAPTILNAANEVAVASFLSGGIGFLDIAAVVEETLERTPNGPLQSLEDVHGTDEIARRAATEIVAARA